jgi:hypothetical protein
MAGDLTRNLGALGRDDDYGCGLIDPSTGATVAILVDRDLSGLELDSTLSGSISSSAAQIH